jgi:hypothetical protein
MRVLIVARGLEKFAYLRRQALVECQTARGARFGSKKNGELLSLAEGAWEVLVTSDRNIKYQQNLANRRIAVLVLRAKSTRIADLKPLIPACAEALRLIKPAEVREVGLL